MMKVNAIKKISCAILCALIMAGAVLAPVTAQAQDESFGKRHQKKELAEGEFAICARKLPLDPVFDHVERVLILVNVLPNYDAGEKFQASFPEPLKKANIESLLKEIYTDRYHKRDELPLPNCYNRENQEVIVMDYLDAKQREKINSLIKKKGTLVAYFTISSVGRDNKNNELGFAYAVSLVHWRTDMPVFDMYRYIGWPFGISIHKDASEMAVELKAYIKSQIRY
ncbi:MAG: hypothetical protein ACK4NR_10380 [Micavibrio sp.]